MCDNNQLNDPVNHPSHYLKAAIVLEPIELTSRLDSCLGQALQYVFRAPYKGNELEDLEKARFYLNKELTLMYRRGVTAFAPLEKDTEAFIRVFHAQTCGFVHDVLDALFDPTTAQIVVYQDGLCKALDVLGGQIGALMLMEKQEKCQ